MNQRRFAVVHQHGYEKLAR